MARKTLLTESEIRRFMKLANMGALGAGKLQEITDEDVVGVEDVAMGPEGGDDLAGLEDEEPEELEPEPEAEVSLSNEEAEALAAAKPAVDKIAAEVGEPEDMDIEAEVELEEPLGGDEGIEGLDFSAEEEEEVPGTRYEGRRRRLSEDSEEQETKHYAEDEDADKRRYDDMLDHVKSLEEHLHALKGDMDYDEEHIEERTQRQDAIVKEVSRRVAARLAKENQQEEMVDHLAERIMARLVKK